jgi:hypothetical protein
MENAESVIVYIAVFLGATLLGVGLFHGVFKKTRPEEFWSGIILLLSFIAVIGLVTSHTALYLMRNNEQRKSRWTIHTFREIGTALQTYKVAQGAYPIYHGDFAQDVLGTQNYDWRILDGWNNPIHYSSSHGTHYSLVSYGKDRTLGGGSGLDSDVVYIDGNFTAPPNLVAQ